MTYSLFALCCKTVVLSVFTLTVANAFTLIRTPIHTPIHTSHTSSTIHTSTIQQRSGSRLYLSKEDEDDGRSSGPKNASTINNEFSRTIRVSKWFSAGGGGSSRSNNRIMNVDLIASELERHALAKRFRLSSISSLTADLTVVPALHGNAIDIGDCIIEASGTVSAVVTQKCVRTNEDFEISMEFSFDTVLKAMTPNKSSESSAANVDNNDEPELSEGELAALEAASTLDGGGRRKNKRKGNKQKNVKGIRGGQSSKDLDGSGMKQLQDILMEYEVSDEIIEDESCFCTDGIVDCGEIVAQMFRSKLDPYPKKPGSDPVSYSFTV